VNCEAQRPNPRAVAPPDLQPLLHYGLWNFVFAVGFPHAQAVILFPLSEPPCSQVDTESMLALEQALVAVILKQLPRLLPHKMSSEPRYALLPSATAE
jgi:hypothetical protein